MLIKMFNKKISLMIFATTIFIFLATFNLQADENKHVEGQSVSNQSSLKIVEPQFVCMVNNKLFNDEQIPVNVEGKTYYGCCEMCKGKLENNIQSRVSIDPVSGVKVDKATSVIGVTASGKVYYFENKSNLQKFGNQ